MDILFVPFYYHIQYRRFQLLEEQARQTDLQCALWYIPNISTMDQSNVFMPAQFKRDQFSYLKFQCLRLPFKWRLLRHACQLITLGIDYYRMKKAIAKMQPKAVMIGSRK